MLSGLRIYAWNLYLKETFVLFSTLTCIKHFMFFKSKIR